MTTIGVLALQGDVREHLHALQRLGVRTMPVRRLEELDACDGLVIPGGESTTMAKLARTFELIEPLRIRIKHAYRRAAETRVARSLAPAGRARLVALSRAAGDPAAPPTPA